MTIIRSKKDVKQFLESFEETAAWDGEVGKRYFVFEDRERGGIWTLMRYADGTFTVHGKGESYCDEGEAALSAEEAVGFLWKHRSAINRAAGAAA